MFNQKLKKKLIELEEKVDNLSIITNKLKLINQHYCGANDTIIYKKEYVFCDWIVKINGVEMCYYSRKIHNLFSFELDNIKYIVETKNVKLNLEGEYVQILNIFTNEEKENV
jgi:hypothetical protein